LGPPPKDPHDDDDENEEDEEDDDEDRQSSENRTNVDASGVWLLIMAHHPILDHNDTAGSLDHQPNSGSQGTEYRRLED
jgi:hypothetical protein